MESTKKSSYCGNLWLAWVHLCNTINLFFSKLCYKWAGFCGRHRSLVICISICVSLGLAVGFLRFNKQNSGDRLYFEQSNAATRAMDRSLNSFPSKSRQEMAIITMKDGSSVINEKALKWGLKIHEGLMKTQYTDICTRTDASNLTSGCLYVNILEAFDFNNMNSSSIQEMLLAKINDEKFIMQNGRTVEQNKMALLGKLIITREGNNITKVDGYAFKFDYFSYISTNDETYEKIVAAEKTMLDYWDSQRVMMEADGVLLHYNTFKSLDDNIAESSGGDIKYVVVSIAALCTFTAIVMARITDKVAGHFLVGMCGMGCVILGVGSAFGLVMACGQYYVSLVGVLPFLILGVGIDDMFIIIDAVDHVDKDILGLKRLQIALSEIGASVTMTTITDLVAFAVSASSAFPSIEYFCTYAACAIIFSYILIMSLLLAVISWDIERIESGKWNLIPCKKVENYEPWVEAQETIANKAMHAWGKFLMKTPVKIIVVILCLGLFGVSVWGALNVDEKFELKQLAIDDSMFSQFLDIQREYFPAQYAISIIQDNSYDYTTLENQDFYKNISNICMENDYLRNDQILNWMTVFLASPVCVSNRLSCNGNNFKPALQDFLRDNPKFKPDVNFDINYNILSSRVICFEENNYERSWRKDSMLEIRSNLRNYKPIKNLYPIHVDFFWREQMAVVRSETLKNLGICAVAITIITAPYLVHPTVILLTSFGFVTLVFELFALMTIWDVSLNSISMIISIMAIGFAVDYSAHVAHAYIMAKGDTAEDRMISALREVGASVLKAGLSTFFGICILASGESEIFRIFFRMMFGIVVLGLLNGLLFLPVFLSIFCRKKLNIQNATFTTTDTNQNGATIQNGAPDVEKSIVSNTYALNDHNKTNDGQIPMKHSNEINNTVASNDKEMINVRSADNDSWFIINGLSS